MCDNPHWGNDSSAASCQLKNPHYIIRELCFLFQDDTANKMVHRHIFLIDEYLQTSKQGFYAEDLRYLALTLEYLSEHVDKEIAYRIPLRQILESCRLPLILRKPSSILLYARELQEYFTILGYLIVTLPDDDLQLIVMEIIQCLLTQYSHVAVDCVKLHDCQSAVEKSRLPTTLAELVEIASPAIFPHILDVMLLIVNVSELACRRMIEAGALEGIFLRMDPEYFSRDLSQVPPLSSLEAAATIEMTRCHEANMSKASSILWGLLSSLNGYGEACKVCTCKSNQSSVSLWCVRFVFRYYVLRSGNVANRNDLLALIVLALAVLPDLPIVPSGLADDIILLSIASEVGADNSWAAAVKFTPTEEDVQFKKMLLLAVCYVVRIPAGVELLRQYSFMCGVLDLVNPGILVPRIPWSAPQFLDLVTYALRTLSFLVPVLRTEFVQNQGTTRLLLLISWYNMDLYDIEILHNCLRTLSVILSLEDDTLLDAFRVQGAPGILFGICDLLLDKEILTTAIQRILTHAAFCLERLLRNNALCQCASGQQVIDTVTRMFRRVVEDRPEDTRTDQRLLISMVDLLWEAVVWCPDNVSLFVRQGGVYVLLDTMQKSIFCSKAIFLSTLVDLVEQGDCVPHLITWRDAASGDAYQPVLAQLWREEEARKRVKRTPLGAVEDIEVPIMGEDQWYYTFSSGRAEEIKPQIADLFASLRPKIYSITQILKQRHSDKVARAQEYYRMGLLPLSTKDQVTYALATNYLALKLGEVWQSNSADLAAMGVNPIGVDGDLISVMRARVLQWVALIQSNQRAILVADKTKKLDAETTFYAEQHENHLAPALDAMHQLDYIARTTDREFLLAEKEKEMEQVQHSLLWPADAKCCHRTYPENITVTLAGGQEVTVISVGKEVGMEQDLQLINDDLSKTPCRPFHSNSSLYNK